MGHVRSYDPMFSRSRDGFGDRINGDRINGLFHLIINKVYMDVSKNRGILPPKMDGLFHGKPYEQMDDLGVPLFLETPIWGEKNPLILTIDPNFRPRTSKYFPFYWLFNRDPGSLLWLIIIPHNWVV